MATCKDCFHGVICNVVSSPNSQYEQNAEKWCQNFKPTADVVEVKYGEWIKHKRNIPKMRDFHKKGMGLHMSEKSIFWACSCCGQWGNPHDKYCRVCGAKMDGVKEE